MRYTLIDRIIELEPGEKITATKSLSLAEEYLQDHFPRFPVMPGVLMLESMTQASAWLVRHTEDFAHSVVVLKEARNVKYADFVQPGQVLTITAEVLKHDARETLLKTIGQVNGKAAVSARLVIERFNMSDENPEFAATDAHTRRMMRELFDILYEPAAVDATASQS